MASDVIFEDANGRGFDSNIDLVFMNDGVMDPKELYMTDMACTKDAASSSDSGISTHDDMPDIPNDYDTDLQYLIDSDFKDLDFNLEHALSNDEQESLHSDLTVSLDGVKVKTEPLSPPSRLLSESGLDDVRFGDTLSPNFYTVCEEISLNNDSFPVVLPIKSELPEQQHQHQQHQQQQQVYFQEIPDQHQQFLQQQSSPTYSPHSTTDHCQQTLQHSSPPSPLSSLPSPTQTQVLASPTVVAATTLSLQEAVNQCHVPVAVATTPPTSPSSPPPLSFTVLPSSSTSQPGQILVLPQVKQEVLPATPSPPSSHHHQQHTVSAISLAPPAAAVDLSAILNSKIKIQPKPGREKVLSIVTSSQRLPLAANQVPVPSQAISVGNLVTTSSLMSPNGIASLTDAKNLKRAQRIIKNRESASLSRKRKKEYMSSLEERLQACVDENSRLMRENQELKKQVDSLTQENQQLKVPSGASPAKKVCLMCFALLLMLNLSPISFTSVPAGSLNRDPVSLPHRHTGRQLLSMPPSGASVEDVRARPFSSLRERKGDPGWPSLDEELRLMAQKLNITAKVAEMCPKYFNSTESLRLAEQLTGWMIRQEEEKKKKEEKKRQKNEKRKKIYPTLRRFGASAYVNPDSDSQRSGRNNHGGGLFGSPYALQVFNGPDPRQQMLNAIPRRNDTFYILSFSTDYFLVPASAHNKTQRPRMSLLMPVFTPTLNETTGQSEDSVAMMQIDCEIHNTNLVHVQRSSLPKDATLNSTTAQEHHFHTYSSSSSRDDNNSVNGSNNNNNNNNRGEERHSRGSNNITAGGDDDGGLREQGDKYWENIADRKAFP